MRMLCDYHNDSHSYLLHKFTKVKSSKSFWPEFELIHMWHVVSGLPFLAGSGWADNEEAYSLQVGFSITMKNNSNLVIAALTNVEYCSSTNNIQWHIKDKRTGSVLHKKESTFLHHYYWAHISNWLHLAEKLAKHRGAGTVRLTSMAAGFLGPPGLKSCSL